MSSGTAGLHLLCRIAGIGPGDEVITSPISFVASANCFILEGGTPVFADVDPRTLNLDPEAVEAAITERTKAIVAVDMFGYPCELDELRDDRRPARPRWSSRTPAEALGAEYKGRPIGSHGPSAVFGFYPNKQITTGEGGVVVTHSEEERRQLVSLRNQGRSYEGGGWFHHVQVGFNYRWTDIQAAIGIAQLEKLDEILALRRERRRALHGAARRRRPSNAAGRGRRRSRAVVVRLRRPARAGASTATASWRRCARTASPPPSTSRACTSSRTCASCTASRKGTVPVAEDASRRTLALPFHTGIDEADQERVVDTLRRALG